MEQLIIYILRALSIAFGALFCYGAAFLYEDEEAKVQNVLEKWWIRIDDLKRVAVSRHSAITRTAAEFAGTILDRIFGKKIISLRAIAVAGCLSLASLHFVAVVITNGIGQRPPGYHIDLSKFANPWDAFYAAFIDLLHVIAAMFFTLALPSNPIFMHLIGICAIIAVVLAALIERLCWLPLVTFSVFVGVYLCAPLISKPYPEIVAFPFLVLSAVVLGMACDVIAVALARILLRWQADWTSLVRTFFAAMLQLLMAIALFALPLATGFRIMNLCKGSSIWWLSMFGWAMTISPATNLLSAIMALAFFGAAMVLVIHRLIWPIITRPLYRLARGGVFRTPAARTALLGVGVGLILFGIGKGGDLLLRLFTILGAA